MHNNPVKCMVGKRFLATGLPEAGLPFPNGWVTVDVLAIVLLVFEGSGLTSSGVVLEMFLKVSLLAVELFFLKTSVFAWVTIGLIAVMLLLVIAGLWLIPGICLQVVVFFDRSGSAPGIVFPTSVLVCGELPLEVFRKVSVFVLGGCSRTSGIL